jgi:predicted glutamine amidotransferase
MRMCELLAISSGSPVTVAYYEAGDVRLIRDTTAASESPWVRFVEERRLCSQLVLSHIRRAGG